MNGWTHQTKPTKVPVTTLGEGMRHCLWLQHTYINTYDYSILHSTITISFMVKKAGCTKGCYIGNVCLLDDMTHDALLYENYFECFILLSRILVKKLFSTTVSTANCWSFSRMRRCHCNIVANYLNVITWSSFIIYFVIYNYIPYSG